MEINNTLLSSLSISIKNDILFMTGCFMSKSLKTPVKNDKVKSSKLHNKIKILLITKNSILFLDSSLNKIEYHIPFDRIRSFTFSVENEVIILTWTDSKRVTIVVKERNELFQSLSSSYSIYYMEKYFLIQDLNIIDKKHNKKDIINHYLDTQYGRYIWYNNVKNNYSYLICGNKLSANNTHLIDWTHSNQKKKSDAKTDNSISTGLDRIEVLVKVSERKEICSGLKNSSLYQDNRDFIMNYITSNTQTNTDYIIKYLSKPYFKKQNLNSDIAKWKGEHLEFQSNTQIISVVLYRRSFIPPWYSEYQDIVIIFSNKLTGILSDDLIKETKFIFETICDSIYDNNGSSFFHNLQYKSLWVSNLEALNLDEDSYDFYNNNLNISGFQCYMNGIKYLYKLLELLCIQDHNEYLWQLLVPQDQKCLEEGDNIVLNQIDIDCVIKDFYNSYTNINGDKIGVNKKDFTYKMWRYLGFVINYGIVQVFGYEELIHADIKTKNNQKSNHNQIHYQILNILFYGEAQDHTNIILKDHTDSTKEDDETNKELIIYNETLFFTILRTVSNKNILHFIDEDVLIRLLTFQINQRPSITFFKIWIIILEEDEIGLCDRLILALITAYNKRDNEENTLIISKIFQVMPWGEYQTQLENSEFYSVWLLNWSSPYEQLIFQSVKLINVLILEFNDITIIQTIPNLTKILTRIILIITQTTRVSSYIYSNILVKSCFTLLSNILRLSRKKGQRTINQVLRENSSWNEGLSNYIEYYIKNNTSKIGNIRSSDLFSLQIAIFTFMSLFLKNNLSNSLLTIKYKNLITDICKEHVLFISNISISEEGGYTVETKLIIKKWETWMKLSLCIFKQNKEIATEIKEIKNSPFWKVLNTLQLLKKNREKTDKTQGDEHINYSYIKEEINKSSVSLGEYNSNSITTRTKSVKQWDNISKWDLTLSDISINKDDKNEFKGTADKDKYCGDESFSDERKNNDKEGVEDSQERKGKSSSRIWKFKKKSQ